MSEETLLIAGPAGSGKTAAAIERYRRGLADQPIGSMLWIAPTNRAVDEIRRRLLGSGLSGCFSPGIFTFARFAEVVLADAEQPIRHVGKLLKRQMIERILNEIRAAGKLNHFLPIADTPGLVDLIAALISDLKRQEIWPDKFAKLVTQQSPTAKNRELALIYDEYQNLLNKHSLYDAEGRFWSAREMLKDGQWGLFSQIKRIVVDGFTDFTFTQHEILQLLAARTDELAITLTLEEKTRREDLLLKPTRTLAELRQRHAQANLVWLPRPASSHWPAMSHLERQLFGNPRELTAADDVSGIEIVAASSQLAELQSIARRIKDLLVTGEPTHDSLSHLSAYESRSTRRPAAQDIAVVFRSLDGISNLVAEVFNEYGIPIAIESAAPLRYSPVLTALVNLLRLQAEDWPFRQLLTVIANNYFQPSWKEWQEGAAGVAAEWAIRRLQIPRGRGELLRSLERNLQSPIESVEVTPDGDSTDERTQRKHRQKFEAADRMLRKLSVLLTQLDRPRTLVEWMGAIEEVAKATGLLRAMQASVSCGGWSKHDEASWQRLKDALAAGNQLEQWLEAKPSKLSLAQFITRLQEIVAVEPLPEDFEEAGRVRVLSAQSVRGIEVPYLFVAGLSEKAFPPPARDDRIYSEAECRRWNSAGLRFVDQHQRTCEEMLLFYEVVTRATRRLTLSYPALDESAQPLLPSPYLTELRRCLGEDRFQPTHEISLSPVPRHVLPYSGNERRVMAVVEWLDGKPQRLAAILGSPLAGPKSARGGAEKATGESETRKNVGSLALLAGLQAIAARANRQSFSDFEGIFTSDAAKRQLAAEYGPEHCWSVSRLEGYAECPFRFLLHNLLGIETVPELSLETNYGRRGVLAHEALARLHRQLNVADQRRSPADVGQVEFERLCDESIAELIRRISDGPFLQAALESIDVRLVAEWFAAYFDQHLEYDKQGETAQLRPAHFEVSFGMKPRNSDGVIDSLSTDKPFIIKCGESEIRLAGRVDRIDVGVIGDRVVFNILDYKTGAKQRIKIEDIHAGLALQLPLYAMAVEELLLIDRRAKPWRVGYWYLKATGFESHGLPQFWDQTDGDLAETQAWSELRRTLLERVVEIVQGIRSGMFPVYSRNEDCTSLCEYSTVCRIGQVRSLGKGWLPLQSERKSGKPVQTEKTEM
ncbi:MAG: PD-(D/E)XK nuclease family protein [Pirellulales bacterium]|nr:PD-(D/E)XK nuclease family protein [Pirellulales bacterium]